MLLLTCRALLAVVSDALTLREPEGTPGAAASAVSLPASDARSSRNVLFDAGVIKYFQAAGAALPPAPLESRRLCAAAVWYVEHSNQLCRRDKSVDVFYYYSKCSSRSV